MNATVSLCSCWQVQKCIRRPMGGYGSIYLLYTDRNSSSFKQHMVKFLDRSKHVKELCTWILHSYICDSINWSGMSRVST